MSYDVGQEVYTPISLVAERTLRTYVLPAFTATAPVPSVLDICGRWPLNNAEKLSLQLPLPTDQQLAVLSGSTRYLFSDFMDGYDVYNGETLDENSVIEVWDSADIMQITDITFKASPLDASSVTLTFVQA